MRLDGHSGLESFCMRCFIKTSMIEIQDQDLGGTSLSVAPASDLKVQA